MRVVIKSVNFVMLEKNRNTKIIKLTNPYQRLILVTTPEDEDESEDVFTVAEEEHDPTAAAVVVVTNVVAPTPLETFDSVSW